VRNGIAWLMVVAVVQVAIGGCDTPGYAIHVQNSSSEEALVRVVQLVEGTFVVQAPPGKTVGAYGGLGSFRGTVELLTDNCVVLDTVEVEGGGALVTVEGTDQLTAQDWGPENPFPDVPPPTGQGLTICGGSGPIEPID
jgi:hypothetical protein